MNDICDSCPFSGRPSHPIRIIRIFPVETRNFENNASTESSPYPDWERRENRISDNQPRPKGGYKKTHFFLICRYPTYWRGGWGATRYPNSSARKCMETSIRLSHLRKRISEPFRVRVCVSVTLDQTDIRIRRNGGSARGPRSVKRHVIR